MILLELTYEEANAVATLLNKTVCGDPNGPRRHLQAVSQRLRRDGAVERAYVIEPSAVPGTVAIHEPGTNTINEPL